jgi:hypothetical protein
MELDIDHDNTRGNAIVATAGRYQVVGYQKQGTSAIETNANDRLVQVFYVSGSFPKSGASLQGPIRHEMTFRVQLTASRAASVDLSVLENPSSTDLQKSAALAAVTRAASLADDSFDELLSAVFGVILDNRDLDFGMDPPGASRWIQGFSKNPPNKVGGYVTITGSFDVQCNYFEALSGAEALNDVGGVIQPTTIDVDVVNDDDTNTKQGVQVDNPGP